MKWTALGNTSELSQKNMSAVNIAGHKLLVIFSDNKFYCFRDRCSHQDIPLSSFGQIGSFEGQDSLTCFAHGAVFALNSGNRIAGPECSSLESFPIKDQAGILYAELP